MSPVPINRFASPSFFHGVILGPAVASWLFLAMVLALLAGCKQPPEPSGPIYSASPKTNGTPLYHFAVHPLHNPHLLAQAYQPLIDYLNRKIPGTRFELEASRDYASYEVKLRTRQPEFLLPNPWQSLQAMKVGYHVIAMAGDAADFKGLFITRKDSSLQTPADLKGRIVAYPAPTALAACIMPQWYLHQHGIDVNHEIDNRYVGSQESSIMNAWLGQAAAGATWPPPWRAFQKEHPREAAELRVIWETPSLLNNAVMVRDDIPAALRDQVRALLIGLHQTDEGQAILGGMEISRFLAAEDDSYAAVRDFVALFEREVRAVETK